MNQDIALKLIPIIAALDAKFHPLLKQAIASNFFDGPLAKFQPVAVEVDTVLGFLEAIGVMQIPTA